MSYNSGAVLANVTGSVTMAGGSVTSITGTRSTAGTTTLGTVGAGKKWYIVGVSITHSNSANSASLATIEVNGVAVIGSLNVGVTSNSTVSNVSLSFDYSACPQATAGQTVTLTTTGSVQANAYVNYVEVTV